jgi:DNA-binding NtrC family response regulator
MSNGAAENPEWAHEGGGAANRSGKDSELVIVAIDDDPGILAFYEEVLGGMGVRVESSTDPRSALELIIANDPSLVIVDLTMPGIDGIELLRRIRDRIPQARVVMVTGNYSIETAVRAIQEGAIDYVCKPVSIDKLGEIVARLRTLVEQEERATALERELAEVCNLEGIIGRSPPMVEVFDLVRRAAPHFRTALVLGETGTGKEIVARALHNLSPRKHRRFAVCNCAALPDTLAESELFGYRKGAFTGATEHKVGFFEWADGGTVFLDEIGELSPSVQSKLLRVLQTGEVQKLGVPEPQRVDTLAIAATSCDLAQEVKSGRFRADLWYRISMVQIPLPPLRERQEDIPLLARHFLEQFGKQYQKEFHGFTARAQKVLLAYSWPGNVREMENILGRACLLSKSKTLDLADLPDLLKQPTSGAINAAPTLDGAEKAALVNALQKTKNLTLAARMLGTNRARLYRLMEKHGLQKTSVVESA